MNEDLKPCPFCGNEAEIHYRRDYLEGTTSVCVQCLYCKSQTVEWNVEQIEVKAGKIVPWERPFKTSLDNVIEAWNRRSEDV